MALLLGACSNNFSPGDLFSSGGGPQQNPSAIGTGRVKVGLVLVWPIVGLHAFEWRMARLKPPAATAALAAGRTWDNRAQIDVVEDLAKAGRPAVPVVTPKTIILLEKGPLRRRGGDPGDGGVIPLGGVSGALAVVCNEGGTWAINEVDAQGRPVGHDQIPWAWTLSFTATSCSLGDGLEIKTKYGQDGKPAVRESDKGAPAARPFFMGDRRRSSPSSARSTRQPDRMRAHTGSWRC